MLQYCKVSVLTAKVGTHCIRYMKRCSHTSGNWEPQTCYRWDAERAPGYRELCLPDGEMCLQEMEGSGFPVARHIRVTLLPSFTTMSVEIRYIFGETGRKQENAVMESCWDGTIPPEYGEESWDTRTAKTMCGSWNITMQTPCSGAKRAIPIMCTAAQTWIQKATSKKAAIPLLVPSRYCYWVPRELPLLDARV